MDDPRTELPGGAHPSGPPVRESPEYEADPADASNTGRDSSAIPSLVDSLTEKLPWLMLFRLLLVTFLLGSAVVVNVNEADTFSDPSYVAILAMIVATYGATVLYAGWLRSRRALRALALTQLAGDSLLTAGLVFLTGGVESIFSFLFFLTVFNGAILMGRQGALFAASGSALGLAAIALIQFAQVEWFMVHFPEAMPRVEKIPVYAMTVQLVGFYTVAALSGYLAEKLGQMGTELERRAIDLQDLRVLHETVIRSIDQGLLAVDHDDRLLFANAEAEAVTGVPLRRRGGRFIGTVAPDLTYLLQTAFSESSGHIEANYRRPGATQADLLLSASVSTLRHPEGHAIGRLVVLRDITELRLLQSELTRQKHLASIGNLAASIAHEIRNPLAAISGSIEVLRMDLRADDDRQPLMDIVIREVDRLNGLIGDFLDYARPRQMQPRNTAINELVRHTVAIFQRDVDLGAGIEVLEEFGCDDSLCMDLDADRIQQVLWNLLRNAAEATASQGRLVVGTALHGMQAHGVPAVMIWVDDNGPGLAEDLPLLVFEPFFTTKPSGTGLGLATSHRIVSEHRGTLRAYNLAAGGARFELVLPLDGDTILGESAAQAMNPDRISELHVPRVRTGGFSTV